MDIINTIPSSVSFNYHTLQSSTITTTSTPTTFFNATKKISSIPPPLLQSNICINPSYEECIKKSNIYTNNIIASSSSFPYCSTR